MRANTPPADQHLINQCQANDPEAWDQLDARLRERGHHLLPKALGQAAADEGLIDDLIEDTLMELVLQKQVLAAFHESGRPLNNYLDYLLNRRVKHYYQERKRRLRHEKHVSEAQLAELAPVYWLPDIEQDLIQCLTRAERRYLEWAKQPPLDAPPCPFRDSYARELERRILKKARRLLYGE